MMPVVDMVGTGMNIVALREKAGKTVKDIQEVLCLATPNTIYKWQKGECLPTLDNLVILADFLGVTINDVIVTTRR